MKPQNILSLTLTLCLLITPLGAAADYAAPTGGSECTHECNGECDECISEHIGECTGECGAAPIPGIPALTVDIHPTVGINSLMGAVISPFSASSPAKIVADNHNLMLRVDGRLFGWGDNTFGQLGFGAGAPLKISEPTEISFFENNGLSIKDIYVVEDASYVLTVNGELYVTGKGLNGRLGTGGTSNLNIWTKISLGASIRVERLYTGREFVLAETNFNELYGWGRNNFGQIGVGGKSDVLTPAVVMYDVNIKHLVVGNDFAGLLKQNNDYYVWGNANNGRYGFNTEPIAAMNESLVNTGSCPGGSQPIVCGSNHPTGNTGVSQCNGGHNTTYAGYNGTKPSGVHVFTAGELLSPVKITGSGRVFENTADFGTWDRALTGTLEWVNSNITAAAASADGTAVCNHPLVSMGQGMCYTCDSEGSYGYRHIRPYTRTRTQSAAWDYTLTNAFEYFDTSQITRLQHGTRHGVALINGVYYSWGDNSLHQQLGDGAANGAMVPMTAVNNLIAELDNGEGFQDLIVAGDTSFIITGTGNVIAWGGNAHGIAGVNVTAASIDTPRRVNALEGKSVAALVPGRSHIITLTHTGDVYSHGDNTHGQLGLGGNTAAGLNAPVLVETFKFSENALPPDTPDNVYTPNEVEAGTAFEISWTNVGAESYVIERHFTPAAGVLSAEVVYAGSQTRFSDTVHDEGDAFYTARAVSFMGDKSNTATSGIVNVVAPSNNNGGDNNNGSSNGSDNNNNYNGNNNNNNGTSSNNGGAMSNDQLLLLLAALGGGNSGGLTDAQFAAILRGNNNDSGQLESIIRTVTQAGAGTSNDHLLPLITALMDQNRGGQSATGANDYLWGLLPLIAGQGNSGGANAGNSATDLLATVMTYKLIMDDSAADKPPENQPPPQAEVQAAMPNDAGDGGIESGAVDSIIASLNGITASFSGMRIALWFAIGALLFYIVLFTAIAIYVWRSGRNHTDDENDEDEPPYPTGRLRAPQIEYIDDFDDDYYEESYNVQ